MGWLLLVVVGLAVGGPAAAQSCSTPTVQSAAGAVCGVYDTTTVGGAQAVVPVYRGIRYATAARWRPAQAAAPATIRATAFGAMCPQGGAPMDTTLYAEDCLFLNVWTPPAGAASGPVPVMVFVHGGAFVTGAGSSPTYNGAYLAAADTVVVVTLNYRLGALGFLYAGSAGVPGNFGLTDQQTALRWVRSNIGAFGGDTARVTAFGESAGAMSVGLHHFAMPASDSLFRAAIMQSNPMGAVYRTAAQAAPDGGRFQRELCRAAGEGFRCEMPGYPAHWFAENSGMVTTDQVLTAQAAFEGATSDIERVTRGGIREVLPWTPVVDGVVVTGQPLLGYAPGIRRRPYIFGMNRDEGVIFAAYANSALTATEYDALLARVFGIGGAGKVRGFTAAGQTPYSAATAPSVAGMGSPASALSNLVGDMAFDCANLASADSGRAANQRDSAQAPVFGYLFERSPVPIEMYPNVEECTESSRMVCHGDELAYVFNTLASVDSIKAGSAPLAPADTALARQMAGAWGSFAKNPTQSPVAGWTPYTPGGSLYPWTGAQNGPMRAGVAGAANCTALWNALPPLNGS